MFGLPYISPNRNTVAVSIWDSSGTPARGVGLRPLDELPARVVFLDAEDGSVIERILEVKKSLANAGRIDSQLAAKSEYLGTAAYHGRMLVINRHCAGESTGHGSPLPHLVHGGPGRAGGGGAAGGRGVGQGTGPGCRWLSVVIHTEGTALLPMLPSDPDLRPGKIFL